MAHAEIYAQREVSGKVSEKQMKTLRHISCYGREVASDFPSLIAVIEQQQNEVALKVPGVVGGCEKSAKRVTFAADTAFIPKEVPEEKTEPNASER